ncbi:MAG TPA: hypothetical protein VH855_06170 [Acetobacteraceae bacterium]
MAGPAMRARAARVGARVGGGGVGLAHHADRLGGAVPLPYPVASRGEGGASARAGMAQALAATQVAASTASSALAGSMEAISAIAALSWIT